MKIEVSIMAAQLSLLNGLGIWEYYGFMAFTSKAVFSVGTWSV